MTEKIIVSTECMRCLYFVIAEEKVWIILGVTGFSTRALVCRRIVLEWKGHILKITVQFKKTKALEM